jgi:protein O-GlcNAc transferase
MTEAQQDEPIQKLLEQALGLQNVGRKAEAARGYRQVLAREPENPDANHLLGVMALEAGNPRTAAELISTAIAALPGFAEAHGNLGNALQALGRSDDAIAAYGRAIDLKPDLIQFRCNLATVLAACGKPVAALDALKAAIEFAPEHPAPQVLLARLLRGQGRATEAETVLMQTLNRQPGLVEAWVDLCDLLSDSGRHQDAADQGRRATEACPDAAAVHGALGRALQGLRQFDAACDAFQNAHDLRPDDHRMLNDLGSALIAAGRPKSAVDACDRVLAGDPENAIAFNTRGSALYQLGRHAEAVEALWRAVEFDPDYVEAHNNLGNVLRELGDIETATAAFRRALIVRPDFGPAQYNLGGALSDQGDYDDAIAAYRIAVRLQPDHAASHYNLGNALARSGDAAEAAAAFRQAIALAPDLAQAHNNLGNALRAQGRSADAIEWFERAIEIQPNYAIALTNLGTAQNECGNRDGAIEAYQRAIAAQPDLAEAHSNLGNVLKDQGRMTEAVSTLRRALDLNPDFAAVHSNLLFALNYVIDIDDDSIVAEHRAFDTRHAVPLAPVEPPPIRDPDPDRRLRIGYVSPDFRHHAVANFIEPFLKNHDKAAVSVHCYFNSAQGDDVTARLRTYADHWIECHALGDEALAARIRDDGIDILVDLTGHSAFNRLLVFARRPAPIQVTWIGYSHTTGLSAMDYRITDAFCDPDGETEDQFSETLARLPARVCFQPPANAPAVGPLPALANGFVTFVSVANRAKVNAETLGLWARIVEAVPNSKLVILHIGDETTAEATRRPFVEHGINPARLDLRKGLPFEDYLALHNEVDMGLDSYPYNGSTTTYTAAWMGVPQITRRGDRPCSRLGTEIMLHLGLDELVARSADDFVDRAVALALDKDRLREMRESLRPGMEKSLLTDSGAHTRALEDLYRRLWRHRVAPPA